MTVAIILQGRKIKCMATYNASQTPLIEKVSRRLRALETFRITAAQLSCIASKCLLRRMRTSTIEECTVVARSKGFWSNVNLLAPYQARVEFLILSGRFERARCEYAQSFELGERRPCRVHVSELPELGDENGG